MNWAIFSLTGYLSVALLLVMPVLWLLHEWLRPRRWLVHVSLGIGVLAFVLATINSQTYVNRIEVNRSQDIEEQMSRQEMARKAAEEQRAEDVADIRFAEDASGDFLDMAGLDEADMKYFASFGDEAEPQWKQRQQTRSLDAEQQADDLESMIGAGGDENRQGLETEAIPEAEPVEPILMSDADMLLANRLDAWNLWLIQLMLAFAAGLVVFDYVRRLNVDREVYLPLPVPSRLADALTPRDPIARSDEAQRSLIEELKMITRRGESFLLLTADHDTAEAALQPLATLPGGQRLRQATAVTDDAQLNDPFVFETLWFGRGSFVASNPARIDRLYPTVLSKLAERRDTRARVRQTVHVIWNLPEAPTAHGLDQFARLGRATGFRLVIRTSQMAERKTQESS